MIASSESPISSRLLKSIVLDELSIRLMMGDAAGWTRLRYSAGRSRLQARTDHAVNA